MFFDKFSVSAREKWFSLSIDQIKNPTTRTMWLAFCASWNVISVVSAYVSPTVHDDIFYIRPTKKCRMDIPLSRYIIENGLLEYDDEKFLEAGLVSGGGYYRKLREPSYNVYLADREVPKTLDVMSILERRDQVLAALTLKFYQSWEDETPEDELAHKIDSVTLAFAPKTLTDVIDARLLPGDALLDFAKSLPCVILNPEDAEFSFPAVMIMPDDPEIQPSSKRSLGQWHLGGPDVDYFYYPFGANILTAWADYRGEAQSADIAIIGPGCSFHPDLQHAFRHYLDYNFFSSLVEAPNTYWGTPVAGMIGATPNNGYGGSGICWNCQIYCYKVYQKDNVLDRAALLSALRSILETSAKVVYLGYTSFEYSVDEAVAIESLAEKGVLIVAPAGNQGCDVSDQSPSNEFVCRDNAGKKVYGVYPALYASSNLLVVGSTDEEGRRAPFSNFGKHLVHIMAPGTKLLLPSNGESFSEFDGTEFSAALVAGIAALMYSKDPTLSAMTVKNLLISTAQPGASSLGCSLAANTFIQKALNTDTPSTFFGLVQSSFIGGLSVASLFFAHAMKKHSSLALITGGMFAWIVAMVVVGFSGLLKSYWGFVCLFLGRVLSGVAEGGLISFVPPLILEHASGVYVGYWMGAFCSLIPIGTAVGFLYGGQISEQLGWNFSFFILAAVSAVVLGALMLMPQSALFVKGSKRPQADQTLSHALSSAEANEAPASPGGEGHLDVESPAARGGLPLSASLTCDCASLEGAAKFTKQEETASSAHSIYEDLYYVLTAVDFLCIALAYAALSTVMAVFSAFGSAFLQGLNFVETEATASLVMGAIVVVTGLLGGFAGGGLISLTNVDLSPKDNEPTFANSQDRAEVYRADEVESYDHTCSLAPNSCGAGSKPESLNTKSNELSQHVEEENLIVSGYPPIEHSAFLQAQKILVYMLPFAILSAGFLMITAICGSVYLFLGFLVLGLFCMFALQSGLSLTVMLVLTKPLRSLGIATSTFMLHAFGDVPFVILAGSLKDKLAPNCGTLDSKTGKLDPSCFDEKKGLRLTIFIVSAWLVWLVIGIIVAWVLVYRKANRTALEQDQTRFTA